MVKENDEFESGDLWYLVIGVFPDVNMVQTIEHPTKNSHPNKRDYVYWPIKQADDLINKD